MKRAAASLLLILAVAAEPAHAAAQTAALPSTGHAQIPFWPGVVPNANLVTGAEVSGTVLDSTGRPQLVGGKPWTYVDRVSQPTTTIFSPVGRNTGAAVVVFPGGGYAHGMAATRGELVPTQSA